MGKGFQAAKNKQAELLRKMELAKLQTEPQDEKEGEASEELKSSEDTDRVQFDKLLEENLAKQPRNVRPPVKSQPLLKSEPKQSIPNGPKLKARNLKRRKRAEQEKEEQVNKVEEHSSPVGVGEEASRNDFEELVDPITGKTLGPALAAQLVPWVPPFLKDALFVLADPRKRSGDWRQATQQLLEQESPNHFPLVCISADPSEETASWLRRLGNVGTMDDVTVLCDRNLEWMTRYSVVGGEHLWSLTLLVFDQDGYLVEVFRDLDAAQACQKASQGLESHG